MPLRGLYTPYDWWRAGIEAATIVTEAQIVIALRMMGVFGMRPMAAGEPLRMVTEKITAAQASGVAATGALMRGAPPAKVARLALAPVRRKTRANVRRLSKPVRK